MCSIRIDRRTRRKRNRVEWSGVEWRGEEWDHQTLVQTLITSHDESADCGGKLGAHLRAISTSIPIALTSGVAPPSIAAHILPSHLLVPSQYAVNDYASIISVYI